MGLRNMNIPHPLRFNYKGQKHGHWEYHTNWDEGDVLMCHGMFNNDKQIGYWEWYEIKSYNQLPKKMFYII